MNKWSLEDIKVGDVIIESEGVYRIVDIHFGIFHNDPYFVVEKFESNNGLWLHCEDGFTFFQAIEADMKHFKAM